MDETEEGREKRTTGMQEIVRLMYTEVVRIRDVFFVFSSVSFFLFFPSFFFFYRMKETNFRLISSFVSTRWSMMKRFERIMERSL